MSQNEPTDSNENIIDVPYEQIDPQTLRRMIEEFVTADWSDFGSEHAELEGKIDQVLKQLKEKRAKVVFNLESKSANIVKT
jgi:uncharacterized protein YheU (UPF0270 family)